MNRLGSPSLVVEPQQVAAVELSIADGALNARAATSPVSIRSV